MPEKPLGEMLQAEPATRSGSEFAATTELMRDAFITTMRDLASSRREARAQNDYGPLELERHAAFVVRSHIERLFAAASALLVEMRLYEAQAVLASIDMAVELSRDEGLLEELSQQLQSYERILLEMKRDIAPLSAEELEAVRRVGKAAQRVKETSS